MSENKTDAMGEGNMKTVSKDDPNSPMDTKSEEQEEKLEQEQEAGGDEPSAKKQRMAKDNTMVDTTKAGKDYLGKEKFEESRSSTRAVRDSKASLKRLSTMAKTAKEGEALLKELGHKDENPESDRRRTRSQTRGTPPSSKATPKQDTPKRSRRGRPRKEEKMAESEESQEVQSEEMNSAEEKEEVPNADGPEETDPEVETVEAQN